MSHSGSRSRKSQAVIEDRPYGIMLHDFHADHRLSDADYRVLGSLLYWAYNKPDCWPSVETIARRVGKKVRATQTALKNLEHFGYIRSEPDPAKKTKRRIVLVWRAEGKTRETPEEKPSPRQVNRKRQQELRQKTTVHTCAPKESKDFPSGQESKDHHHQCVPSPELEVTLLTREAQAADDVDWKPPTGGTPDRQRERLIVHLATLAALDRRQRRAAVNAAATLFVDLLMDDGSLDFHRRVCWAVAKGQLSGGLVADAFRATYDQIADRGVGVLGAYYVGCLRNMIGDGALADLMTALAEDPEGAAEEYACIPLTRWEPREMAS